MNRKINLAFTLAEVFSPHFADNRKNAFTLAEVLITLGIIGVVAALTLPTLIQNYKKQQTITGLKKAYTIANQAFKLSEIDNGEYANWTIPEEANPSLSYIQKYFLPYFKEPVVCDTPQKCGYKSNKPFKMLDGSHSSAILTTSAFRTPFLTADGILYSVSVASGNMEPSSTITIDINGPKEPNTYGKDVFEFRRTNKGIIPNGGGDEGTLCTKASSWHCAARIIKDGWEISDDYPW